MSGGAQALRAEVFRLWKLVWAKPGIGTGYAVGAALVIGVIVELFAGGRWSGRGVIQVGAGLFTLVLWIANSINADGNYGRGPAQAPEPATSCTAAAAGARGISSPEGSRPRWVLVLAVAALACNIAATILGGERHMLIGLPLIAIVVILFVVSYRRRKDGADHDD